MHSSEDSPQTEGLGDCQFASDKRKSSVGET